MSRSTRQAIPTAHGRRQPPQQGILPRFVVRTCQLALLIAVCMVILLVIGAAAAAVAFGVYSLTQ